MIYLSGSSAAAHDARISFRARGLLWFLLNQPSDYNVSSHHLAEATQEGRDAVRTALKELRALGYVWTERARYTDSEGRDRYRTFQHATDRPSLKPGKPSLTGEQLSTSSLTPGNPSLTDPEEAPETPSYQHGSLTPGNPSSMSPQLPTPAEISASGNRSGSPHVKGFAAAAQAQSITTQLHILKTPSVPSVRSAARQALPRVRRRVRVVKPSPKPMSRTDLANYLAADLPKKVIKSGGRNCGIAPRPRLTATIKRVLDSFEISPDEVVALAEFYAETPSLWNRSIHPAFDLLSNAKFVKVREMAAAPAEEDDDVRSDGLEPWQVALGNIQRMHRVDGIG